MVIEFTLVALFSHRIA